MDSEKSEFRTDSLTVMTTGWLTDTFVVPPTGLKLSTVGAVVSGVDDALVVKTLLTGDIRLPDESRTPASCTV